MIDEYRQREITVVSACRLVTLWLRVNGLEQESCKPLYPLCSCCSPPDRNALWPHLVERGALFDEIFTTQLPGDTCLLTTALERSNHKSPGPLSRHEAELIHRRAPWKTKDSLELAMRDWVSWLSQHRLLEPIGYIPPAEAEENYYRQLTRQTATMKWLNPTGLHEPGAIQFKKRTGLTCPFFMRARTIRSNCPDSSGSQLWLCK